MNIKKIVLQGSGFKGAVVTYLREEEKNGRPFINEVTEKRKHPIHLSLEKMFKDLRYHLLDITGLLRGDEDKAMKDYTIQECEVVGIEFDAASFILSGEKKVFADKAIKLKTCKVTEEDMYEHFETVQNLIQAIVEETKEYLAGTKKVDDVEVLQRWVQAGKSKELTEESLKNYTPEQLLEFGRKLIENRFGGIVLLDNDMDISNVDVSEANEELKKAEEETIVIGTTTVDVDDEVIISDEETVIPIPVKKEKKAKKEVIEAPISQPLPPAF